MIKDEGAIRSKPIFWKKNYFDDYVNFINQNLNAKNSYKSNIKI